MLKRALIPAFPRGAYHSFIGGLLLAALVTAGPQTLRAADGVAASDAVAAGGLTVVAGPGVEPIGPGRGRLDFGRVFRTKTSTLERAVFLRNDTKEPVRLERLKASCGCTSTVLGEGTGPKVLGPGEQVQAKITINVRKLPASVHKFVWAYGANEVTPLATLEIHAQLVDSVTLSPGRIDFGKVDSGKLAYLPLTLTLDPSLIEAAPLPVLVSSNPDITISSDTASSAPDGAGQVTRRYLVMLSARAHLGPIQGVISFAPPATAGTAPISQEKLTLATALQGVMVNVAGEVLGKLQVAPKMAVLGTVHAGTEAVTEVKLTARDAGALANLKVASASPWVTAQVRAARDTNPDAAATMSVTLSSKAPAGAVETQVVATAADGERLVIPVLAYVVK